MPDCSVCAYAAHKCWQVDADYVAFVQRCALAANPDLQASGAVGTSQSRSYQVLDQAIKLPCVLACALT